MHWFINNFLLLVLYLVRDCCGIHGTRGDVQPPRCVSSYLPVLLPSSYPSILLLLTSWPLSSPHSKPVPASAVSPSPATPGWTLSRVVHSVSACGSCQLSTGYGNVEIREFYSGFLTFLSFSFDLDMYFVMQISTKINESIKVMTLYLYDAAMCISRVVIEVAGRELQQN